MALRAAADRAPRPSNHRFGSVGAASSPLPEDLHAIRAPAPPLAAGIACAGRPGVHGGRWPSRSPLEASTGCSCGRLCRPDHMPAGSCRCRRIAGAAMSAD